VEQATHNSDVDRRARSTAKRSRESQVRVIEVYADDAGVEHELIAQRAAGGSMLVVDRMRTAGGQAHLLAHLAADEPPQNAAIVCSDYLARVRAGGLCACRAVTADDLVSTPATDAVAVTDVSGLAPLAGAEVDAAGSSYSLEILQARGTLAQLRWCRELRCDAPVDHRRLQRSRAPVSLREAIGRIESYEPLRAMTQSAIAQVTRREGLSTAVLRAELGRVQRSPIVLNRGLREAVQRTVRRGELSMSQIAIRCGRVKRDAKGNVSGETSWLGRRLGLLPEGGQSAPTPWVHTEVLALIARRGLGLAPREVEL